MFYFHVTSRSANSRHATMIYVTHDQVEAMTMADRIVVLNHGKIEQVGTPQELYERPANRFVAEFIGAPRMNNIEGEAAAALGAATRGKDKSSTESCAKLERAQNMAV